MTAIIDQAWRAVSCMSSSLNHGAASQGMRQQSARTLPAALVVAAVPLAMPVATCAGPTHTCQVAGLGGWFTWLSGAEGGATCTGARETAVARTLDVILGAFKLAQPTGSQPVGRPMGLIFR